MHIRLAVLLLCGCSLLIPSPAAAIERLDVSPDPPTFADTCKGAQTKVKITLTNNDPNDDVTVEKVEIGGDGAEAFKVEEFTPDSIAVKDGGTVTFQIVFAPERSDTFAATLNLTTNPTGANPFEGGRAFSAKGVDRVLEVVPGSLAFGEQRLGTRSAEKSVTLKNTGPDSVTVQRPTLGGAHAGDFRVAAPSGEKFSIAAGEQQTVRASFQPKVGGNRSGAISLTTNACQSPSKSVALTGVGIAPSIRLDPQVLDLGQVPIGQPSEPVPLVVSNDGKAPLRVTRIQIVGVHSADFVFEALPTLPRVVAAGDSFLLNVIFTPSSDGQRRAGARITSDDPGRSIFEIALTGTGGAASIPPTTSPTATPTDSPTPTTGPQAGGPPAGRGGDWIAIVMVLVLVALAFAALFVLRRMRAEQG